MDQLLTVANVKLAETWCMYSKITLFVSWQESQNFPARVLFSGYFEIGLLNPIGWTVKEVRDGTNQVISFAWRHDHEYSRSTFQFLNLWHAFTHCRYCSRDLARSSVWKSQHNVQIDPVYRNKVRLHLHLIFSQCFVFGKCKCKL